MDPNNIDRGCDETHNNRKRKTHIHELWLDCIFAGVVGLRYALVVRRTGSIYGVSVSHGLINIMLVPVMPNLALSC